MSYKATELAYIASLIDNKGSIRIETPHKAAKSSLYVMVTSPSFKLMEFLQFFGAKIGQPTEDGQYRAKWRDNSAGKLLKAVQPWLRLKGLQAEIGIDFIDERNEISESRDATYRLRMKLTKASGE